MIWTQVWAATHIGSVRGRNEDSYGATGLLPSRTDGNVVTTEIVGEPCLAVVADGLGGHPSGDLASRLAVQSVLDAEPGTADELVDAVTLANDHLYSAMTDNPDARGMGTTLAALLIGAGGITVVNVGDSAVFEVIDGRLVQLSVDDTPSGAKALPGVPAGFVTQTLGGSLVPVPVSPHVHADEYAGDRRFLVCTDGLTSYVPLSEIAGAASLVSGELAVGDLVDRALVAGGNDNVTVLLVELRSQP